MNIASKNKEIVTTKRYTMYNHSIVNILRKFKRKEALEYYRGKKEEKELAPRENL